MSVHMRTVIVECTATATILERWTYRVPVGTVIDEAYAELLLDGAYRPADVELVSCTDEVVGDERDREFVCFEIQTVFKEDE